MMNIQSNISREIFAPQDEKLLVAIEVKKRRKRRLPFLTAGRKRDYVTFLCLSVTNKRPSQVFITKVKQYPGSPRFTKRSQWSVEQLRQVDGINPNKDTPEFDLGFDHNLDQWVAGSSAEKCMFVQILYHACQNYWGGKLGLGAAGSQKGPGASGEQPDPAGAVEKKKAPNAPRPTEFVNCQSKLMGDACSVNMVIYRCKIFLNRMKNTMIASPSQLEIAGLKAPATKAAATKAATSKAATSKAAASKASTTKASTAKASTAKAPSTKFFKPVSSPPAQRSVGSVVRRASHVLSDRDFRVARQMAKQRRSSFPKAF
ncbi:syntaxin binding protein 6 (amisyn), like isoform X1 [Astyanax mexicanus]|uniref:syntaxin binding protein 6 (amisyn), like isoform X1 n=1 Tax=Astyanax mexicanus TaxID=7994 RepID=UPI0020CB07C9|nr:syntaxin binding protein 6 (amisyn), like isoform X1 [Astyanax mexicanus]